MNQIAEAIIVIAQARDQRTSVVIRLLGVFVIVLLTILPFADPVAQGKARVDVLI